MIEMTFMAGKEIMKIRVGEDKVIYASSPKTGLNNFIPHTISKKGLIKARTEKKGSKKELDAAEKELLEDEEFLKINSLKNIIREIRRELAKSGFRMIIKKEIGQ